jgi:predicted transport protein
LGTELLAVDPNITEEVSPLYEAYKADTNFVDLVPQASKLRLSLNMPFPELSDPKTLAENVTDLGRWSARDVEAGLWTKPIFHAYSDCSGRRWSSSSVMERLRPDDELEVAGPSFLKSDIASPGSE